MELEGKTIAVLVEQQYEDLELWYPVLRFREAGATVHIVGPKKESYPSKHGYPAEADFSADKAKAKTYDAVVIPGGYSPDHMRRHSTMVQLVREAAQAGKVVAAICHGGWMLCSAGVLKGKKATCFSSIRDDLVNAGANYVDEEVVRDGNLVTSRFPADLPAFCRTIMEALQ